MDNTAKRYAEFVNGIKSESIVVSTKARARGKNKAEFEM